jgi:hypothetical protein
LTFTGVYKALWFQQKCGILNIRVKVSEYYFQMEVKGFDGQSYELSDRFVKKSTILY